MRPLGNAGSIALFYLAVVREEGHLVDGGLDPQDEAKLVVHLQAHGSQGVLDPRSWDAEIEAVPPFVLVVSV